MAPLNVPAQPTDDTSLLTQRLGPEVVTYGSGSGLNRVSFLRSDTEFLRAAVTHPEAVFIALNKLDPLVAANDETRLYKLRLSDVCPALTGPDGPFDKSEEEMIKAFDASRTYPLILLLGLQEGEGEFECKGMKGRPWFAIDATPRGSLTESCQSFIDLQVQNGNTFLKTVRNLTFKPVDSAIYAHARAIMDWNMRNPFCGACSRRTMAVEAGHKRVCPPALADPSLPPCPIGDSISNLSFPRTDPVVLAAVASRDGKRLLLGRNRKWPQHRYSVLAGFIEAGESVEEAARREVWEESGVTVGRVALHSTQVWPYPNSLVVGVIAQASEKEGAEEIFLGHDKELEDARWFTLEDVSEMLRLHREGLKDSYLIKGDEKFWLPPPQAIANRLLAAVVGGFLTGIPEVDGI